MPTLHLEGGRIRESIVPYHKTIKITGSRNGADLVQLYIVKLGGKGRVRLWPWTWSNVWKSKDDTVDLSCWRAPRASDGAAAASDEFSLVINPLEIGQRYDLRFSFLTSAPVSLDDAQRNAIINIRDAYRANNGITEDQVRVIITQQLDAMVADLKKKGAVRFVNVSNVGRCGFFDKAPAIPLSDAEVRKLKEQAIHLALMLDQGREVRKQREYVWQRVAGTTTAFIDRLREHRELEEREWIAQGKHPSYKRYLLYTDSDLSALAADIVSADTVGIALHSEPATAAFKTAADAPAGRLTPADAALLGDVLNALDNIRRVNAEYAVSAANSREAVKLAAKLEEAYFGSALVSTTPVVPWGVAADVRKVQIGTAYGGGFAWLDVGKNASDDGFAFIALKFYQGAVDKDLPNPWSSPRARWAFMLGGVSKSSITYRGQTQEDALGSLKPMVGLSFDLQRRIALHSGGIVFRQPSVNPLAANARKRLRAAPFIALGFDFDALNELAELISPAASGNNDNGSAVTSFSTGTSMVTDSPLMKRGSVGQSTFSTKSLRHTKKRRLESSVVIMRRTGTAAPID